MRLHKRPCRALVSSQRKLLKWRYKRSALSRLTRSVARGRRGARADAGMRSGARDRVVDRLGSGEAIVPRMPGRIAQNREYPRPSGRRLRITASTGRTAQPKMISGEP